MSGDTRWHAVQRVQCPVCLCEVGHENLTYPFDCEGAVVHGVCRSCHENLVRREMLRCPLCRAHSRIPSPRGARSEPGLDSDLHARGSQMRGVRPTQVALPESMQRTARLANALFNAPGISASEFRMLLGHEQAAFAERPVGGAAGARPGVRRGPLGC